MSKSLDTKYIALFERASAALAKENRALERAFAATKAKNGHHYLKVGHGLTYWLFETTLVYVIFKDWLRDTPVVWEHALARSRDEKKGQKTVDLVVFDDGREEAAVEAAIEAKWWNDSRKKTRSSLESDVKKLRAGFPDAKRRYLMTFWWCKRDEAEFRKELRSAKKTIRELSDALGGLRHLASTPIPTKLSDGSDGYFVLTAIRV